MLTLFVCKPQHSARILSWLRPKWARRGQLRCFHMCCVSKHSIDLGVPPRLFLIAFLSRCVSGSLSSTVNSRPILANLHFWLHRTTRGLLDLPEESDFWGMFNRSCQTENSPQGSWPPVLAQSAHGCFDMLRVAPTALRNGPTEGPSDKCLTADDGFQTCWL